MGVLLNENHPGYRHIKEGRTIRTTIAKSLCEKCNMQWDEPVSIDQIEQVEKALKCNIYVLDANNLPILNTTTNILTSLMYKSKYNEKYKQCWLLFDDDHYHCITNTKGLLATKFFCKKCCSCFNHKTAM